VHLGFDSSARSIFPEVCEWLDEEKSRQTYICGHSLGAAVATLLASKLSYTGYRISGLLTMSSPRVGNRKFRNLLNSRLGETWIRTQVCRDMVPRLPPLFFGYHHGGKHVYFDRRDECHIKPYLSYQLHDRLMDWIADWSNKDARGIVDDHSAEENLRLVRMHAEKITR
jgi:predicted lipase